MNAVSIFLDRIGMQAYDVDYCYTPYTCSAVCLCVYLLVTTVSHTKTDEPIEMSFGGWITLNLFYSQWDNSDAVLLVATCWWYFETFVCDFVRSRVTSIVCVVDVFRLLLSQWRIVVSVVLKRRRWTSMPKVALSLLVWGWPSPGLTWATQSTTEALGIVQYLGLVEPTTKYLQVVKEL